MASLMDRRSGAAWNTEAARVIGNALGMIAGGHGDDTGRALRCLKA